MTLDGFQLNEKGNRLLAHQVAETLFGAQAPHNRDMEGVREAVMEKIGCGTIGRSPTGSTSLVAGIAPLVLTTTRTSCSNSRS